VNQSYS